uniref:C2H2-type domain-containing protein n=1 Tax=Amphilophus citrinellus TaxID=61819 RepID=A0A3Q0S4E0_AMPCI
MHHVTKLKSSQSGFLNMTLSSLHSNGHHSHRAPFGCGGTGNLHQLLYRLKNFTNARLSFSSLYLSQAVLTDDNANTAVLSEIVTLSEEKSDPSDDEEESKTGGMSSDGDWNPTEEFLVADELTKESEEETEDEGCGRFFLILKPHTVDKFKHEQTHQDKKDPFKCPDCPKTFGTSKERRSHLAKHRVSREFKCGVCGIEFKDIHHLRRHSVVHTGLKPYKCSVCQRGFNQTSHLKSHMRLHTGERPYKCQLCDKRFNHNVIHYFGVRLFTSRKHSRLQPVFPGVGVPANSSQGQTVLRETAKKEKPFISDIPKLAG